jgi:anaerobic selenocysteine-containing dehydrogenase
MFEQYRTAAALSRMSQSEIFGGILRGGRGHVAALATQGVPAMPDWQPDPEDKRQAAGWPLRLLTAPGYFQSHTAYSGVSFLRRREGPPCCILHPEEAGARDLWDGRRVRLFNDRGVVGLVLKVSDDSARCRTRARSAARRRDRHRNDQHAMLRPLHRYRRGRHVSEQLGRYRRMG